MNQEAGDDQADPAEATVGTWRRTTAPMGVAQAGSKASIRRHHDHFHRRVHSRANQATTPAPLSPAPFPPRHWA